MGAEKQHGSVIPGFLVFLIFLRPGAENVSIPEILMVQTKSWVKFPLSHKLGMELSCL